MAIYRGVPKFLMQFGVVPWLCQPNLMCFLVQTTHKFFFSTCSYRCYSYQRNNEYRMIHPCLIASTFQGKGFEAEMWLWSESWVKTADSLKIVFSWCWGLYKSMNNYIYTILYIYTRYYNIIIQYIVILIMIIMIVVNLYMCVYDTLYCLSSGLTSVPRIMDDPLCGVPYLEGALCCACKPAGAADDSVGRQSESKTMNQCLICKFFFVVFQTQ